MFDTAKMISLDTVSGFVCNVGNIQCILLFYSIQDICIYKTIYYWQDVWVYLGIYKYDYGIWSFKSTYPFTFGTLIFIL